MHLMDQVGWCGLFVVAKKKKKKRKENIPQITNSFHII